MAIDLIVNPGARLYQSDPRLLGRMQDIARGRCRVHITESLDALTSTCAELVATGTRWVMVSGGDGTLMATTTALYDAFGADAMPAITPIPGGTAGTVARNWKLHGKPTACLERLLRGPRRIVERPSLEVTIEQGDGHVDRCIGFIIGTGLIANFFGLYYERGAPGYAGSAKLVARIFVESFIGGPMATRVLEPLPCELIVGDRVQPPKAWSLICAAVIRDLGIHMLVTYRGGEDFERPHLVATPLTPRKMGPRAPLVLTGRPIGGEHHVDELAESFRIRFAGQGPFVLDGELLQAREISVRAGPRLTVMEP
jgi:hypothetical protein